MKLVTLHGAGGGRPGLVAGEEILDLAACVEVLPAARLVPASVRAILEAGEEALELLRRLLGQALDGKSSMQARLRERGALVARDTARFSAPIPDPGMILSCGMNYRGHLKEMNTPVPDQPTAFFKSVTSLTGPGAPILLPHAHADMVDWEGEFSAVIGRTCHGVSAAEALDYVAGYTLINDVSARDWVAAVFASQGGMGAIHAWDENILGKQFPTFCPLGPVIVTRDELPDADRLPLTTTVNGKVMQSANTDDLVFGVAKLIEYYSQFLMFRPGDVITTGSPAGVGYGRNPKVFLRPGDTVQVTAKGIGTLSNPVAAA
jgi:acylpyruvate hydrolase